MSVPPRESRMNILIVSHISQAKVSAAKANKMLPSITCKSLSSLSRNRPAAGCRVS
jgi:hypothetical protein